MHKTTVAAMRTLAGCVVVFGLLTGMGLSATAQGITCIEAPLLGFVDADADGIATVGEIRAVGPDDADLQSAASRMEAQGVSGIQYSGCDGSGDSGTGGGTNTSGGSGDENDGSGATSATSAGGIGSNGTDETDAVVNAVAGADGVPVSVLPATGHGVTTPGDHSVFMMLLGAASVVALLGAFARRQCRSM